MPRSANRCRPSTTTACCSRRSRPPSIWSDAARWRRLERKRGRGPRPTGVALECHTSVERLSRMSVSTPIRAARGTQLSARGWQQEAALRMLCNNLDPEVAERPEGLGVYGGSQGILQGTYETFGALAAKRFDGTLRGRIVLTSGLGGMGGAQPLAVTMNDGVALCVEVDEARIERRLRTGYLDRATARLDEAVAWAEEARARNAPASIGLVGNAAEVYPELLRRGFEPDVVTDQTSAHDPLRGYIPAPLTVDEAAELRARDPVEYLEMVKHSVRDHVGAMLGFQGRGGETFDYGNNLRGQALDAGGRNAFYTRGCAPGD